MDSLIEVRFSLMKNFVSALKLNLLLSIALSFFLLRRAFLQCFLLTKRIIVFWICSSYPFSLIGVRPLFFLTLYSLQYLIRLKRLYFPINYQQRFVERLIKPNYFFCHTALKNLDFILRFPLCFPKYCVLHVVFIFIL